MQLIVKGGIVVATHDDGQIIDPVAAYGAGATLQALAAGQPVPALMSEPPPVDLTAYAAAARYAKETGGITVGNAPIATDRGSQALITGAWAATQINPAVTVQFKTSAGFVQIGAAQIQAIAAAVTAHVQACFAAEEQIDAGIAAGTITTTAAIDAALAAVTA